MDELVVVIPAPISSAERKRRQVARLFREQKGLCFWCKKLMILFDKAKIRRHRSLPQNLATIDHLDDRYSPNRGKFAGQRRRVLACKHCNELRGLMAQKSQPLEVLHERAQRHPPRPAEQKP